MVVNKQLFATGFIIILSVVIFYFYWQFISFRITSTTPELNNQTPDSTTQIVINFNKDIVGFDKAQSKVFLDGGSVEKVSVDKKSLIITPKSLQTNKTYTLKLINITSTTGDAIGKEIGFKTTFVEFKKLSKKQQDQEVSNIQSDPINELDKKAGSLLPYSTNNFLIEYRLSDGDVPGKITITAQLSNYDYENGNVDQLTNQRHQEAKDFLNANGIDLTKYQIVLR